MERTLSTRAFTLVEIMVSSGLALLLMLVAVSSWLPLQRQLGRSQVRVRFSQTGLVVQQNLAKDLAASARPAIHSDLQPTRLALAIQPLESVDSQSQQVWSADWVGYRWSKDEATLMRLTFHRDLEFNNAPSPLSLAELQQLAAAPPPTRRTLARQLVDFRLELSAQGWGRLECLFRDDGNQPVEVRCAKTLLLRNSVL